jgi:NTE family protein
MRCSAYCRARWIVCVKRGADKSKDRGRHRINQERQRESGIGLALSGGGFRATLFHLGSLWRLNELGYLPKITMITSVSGGSITSGVLASRWKQLNFDSDGYAGNFGDKIVAPLREFCTRNIDVLAGLIGALPFVSGADVTCKRYRKYLFGDATLQDVPEGQAIPRFVFYATSLQTGVSVRFSRKRIGDYKVGELPAPEVSLAEVVAASSAFPPVLSPMTIKTDPTKWRDLPGTTFFGDPAYRERLILTDGGVYDNMGLEAIWDRYETVLVSDTGAPLVANSKAAGDWTNLTKRTIDIVTEQTRALRKRQLISELTSAIAKGAYWGITTNIDHYGLADAMTRRNEVNAKLQAIRTRLNAFSEREQCELINWGYALTDAAMRRHVLDQDPGPGQWPYPDYAV